MAMEIELKAHVKDSEALRQLLHEKAEYKGSFEKEDTYWLFNEAADHKLADHKPAALRIRRENRIFSDGKKESLTFATYKIKQVKDGIEINDEREFEIRSSAVSDRDDLDALLRHLRLTPGLTKRKKGWIFLREDINAELTEVESLGWFIELEILADNDREETVAREKKKLLDFLDSLGIERTAIESRFYSQMITEK